MTTNTAILGLLAQTSIHAGTGQHTGAIDLPIQREGHSGWPCVFGSAVKGALRSHAQGRKVAQLQATGVQVTDKVYKEQVQCAEDIAAVYGPPTTKADEHAGAILVTDARLLLFPVRSLTSQFKWVTCPAAVERLIRDGQWLDLGLAASPLPSIADGEDSSGALVHQGATVQDLFLEEYRFAPTAADLGDLIDLLAGLMRRDGAKEALAEQLVIVGNDSFAHLVQHGTPVNAHIAIDARTKTVAGSALWYEETLPPETLLYGCLSAQAARNGNGELGAEGILQLVLGLFAERPWLQLGGNETVGMGWCAVQARTSGSGGEDSGKGEG